MAKNEYKYIRSSGCCSCANFLIIPRNFQRAVDVGLNQDDAYSIGVAADFQDKRGGFSGGLKNAGQMSHIIKVHI